MDLGYVIIPTAIDAVDPETIIHRIKRPQVYVTVLGEASGLTEPPKPPDPPAGQLLRSRIIPKSYHGVFTIYWEYLVYILDPTRLVITHPLVVTGDAEIDQGHSESILGKPITLPDTLNTELGIK
jgi:hypothetical protein